MRSRTGNRLGDWIRRFLLEYVPGERGLSTNTQASYCDTLRLFLSWAQLELRKRPDEFEITDLSGDIVRRFLVHLENGRGCGTVTRNLRLAALHSLARFVETHSPVHVAWAGDILAVPFKRSARPALGYLEKLEMDAILNAPDRHRPLGARDHAILLFLYNTGSRASEVARIVLADLHLDSSPAWVKIRGKGGKERTCPLWSATVRTLAPLIESRDRAEGLFVNQSGRPLTRFGILKIVRRVVKAAARKVPALKDKRIGPHTIRHTTAVHLVSAGVDINTIREWLGHASLETTNIYAEVALEIKAKALAHLEIKKTRRGRSSRDEQSLMDFLRSLQKPGKSGGLCGAMLPELK